MKGRAPDGSPRPHPFPSRPPAMGPEASRATFIGFAAAPVASASTGRWAPCPCAVPPAAPAPSAAVPQPHQPQAASYARCCTAGRRLSADS